MTLLCYNFSTRNCYDTKNYSLCMAWQKASG